MKRNPVCALACAAVLPATAAVLAAPLPAAAAEHGKPEITRTVTVETFPDDFTRDVCGIEVLTTLTEKRVAHVFPDGSERVHATWTYVPDDPRVAIERASRNDFIDPDGTITITGIAIRLIDQVTGRTIIKDRGRVVFAPDGSVLSVRGPHPFLDVEDLAAVYCPSLA